MNNHQRLELAWEAIQDIYTTYSNIYAYRYGLKTFCSFGEKTYLIKISQKKIQAFYDISEQKEATELGLQDFLNKEWRNTFKNKSETALVRARGYIKKTHFNNEHLSEQELYQRIKDGTHINNELFIYFAACQPQYTSLVEEHIKKQLPDTLFPVDKNKIFLTLTQSEKMTPLIAEEIAWSKLIQRKYPKLELEQHAQAYGLLGSADGLSPWSKEFLQMRLENSLEDAATVHKEEEWDQQQQRIVREKAEVISEYDVSPEVIELCSEIAELGHLRLCLRLEGWMPLAYILMSELFPILPNYLPYTSRQLECCLHTELYKIFDGDRSLMPGKLDERFQLTLYGLLDGEEVIWSGGKAEEIIAELIPSIDTSVTELKGQIGWNGKVQAKCFVLHWNAEDVSKEIERMPVGSVLVAGQTRPQLMAAIKKAAAIVTDEGGVLSHAAIISRELHKPSIIGTKFATKVFKTGDMLEVDADNGVVRILKKTNA